MLQHDCVRFVDKRKDKEPLCCQLGIDAFVDDTLSVLDCFLRSPNGNYSALFLFGNASAFVHNPSYYDRNVTRAHGWSAVLQRVFAAEKQ